jgi:uncharacterized protein (DUF1015 family)
MALYDDPHDKVLNLLSIVMKDKPLETAETDEEKHLVWSINKPEIIAEICSNLAAQSLYIADGHHRYETALNYRNEQRTANPGWTKDDAFNFIMLSMIGTSDSGLLVLPTHRVVKGISAETAKELKVRLETLFDIEDIPVRQYDYALNLMRQSARPVMGLVGPDTAKFQILTLRRESKTPAQVGVLIRLLHQEILEGLVDNTAVEYCSEAKDAVNRVLNEGYQLAFLLNPPSIEEIKAASDCGERMPHKSTFFYPKPPTGLVIRRIEGKLKSLDL